MKITRRNTMRALASGVAMTMLIGANLAHAADDTITIGYAVAKTGPNATGAGITTIPNYELWVKDVNAAGGLGDTNAARQDEAVRACPTGALVIKRVGYAIPVGRRRYDHRPIGSDLERKAPDE